MAKFKRSHLFQNIILGIYVKFLGCNPLLAFTSKTSNWTVGNHNADNHDQGNQILWRSYSFLVYLYFFMHFWMHFHKLF